MCVAKIVLAVFVVTNYIYVFAEDEDPVESPEDKTEPPSLDDPTFVALLDIVFIDGSKRSCTGTIILENVVITAAHCFINKKKQVELSGSFVVIGSKKKFETGDESYLPIERIIIHPRYSGWTADIALVYTFTAMTKDKPGSVIPIKEDGTSTPVKSNVSILSWRHCTDENGKPIKCPINKVADSSKTTTNRDCSDDEDNDEKRKFYRPRVSYEQSQYEDESNQPGTKAPLRMSSSTRKGRNSESNILRLQSIRGHKPSSTSPMDFASDTISSSKSHKPNAHNRIYEPDAANKSEEPNTPNKSYESNVPNKSQVSIEPKKSFKPNAHNKSGIPNRSQEPIKPGRSNKPGAPNVPDLPKKLKDLIEPIRSYKSVAPKEPSEPNNSKLEIDAHKESYEPHPSTKRSNGFTKLEHLTSMIDEDEWTLGRRLYEKKYLRYLEDKKFKESNLTIDTYGIVNINTCKKLIDDAMPPIYAINTKEFVCYANKHHYIDNGDSGAPVIYQGRVLAMTVGGVRYGVEHMGVGIKINCLCSWIVENLPPGNKMECCRTCCRDPETDETLRSQTMYYNRGLDFI